MSVIPEESQQPDSREVAIPVASFKERLVQRRRELEQNTTFELPVPGYADLYAMYRALGFEEIRAIGLRIEEETSDQVTGERLTAAETLSDACIELMERKADDPNGKPVLEGLGYRWSAAAARELFGVELPDGVVARDAIQKIFPYPRDMLMMTHFQDYLTESMGFLPQIEEILRGESPAR